MTLFFLAVEKNHETQRSFPPSRPVLHPKVGLIWNIWWKNNTEALFLKEKEIRMALSLMPLHRGEHERVQWQNELITVSSRDGSPCHRHGSHYFTQNNDPDQSNDCGLEVPMALLHSGLSEWQLTSVTTKNKYLLHICTWNNTGWRPFLPRKCLRLSICMMTEKFTRVWDPAISWKRCGVCWGVSSSLLFST